MSRKLPTTQVAQNCLVKGVVHTKNYYLHTVITFVHIAACKFGRVPENVVVNLIFEFYGLKEVKMGMFTENYSGNRCSDCTWADNMEEKLKSLQQTKPKICPRCGGDPIERKNSNNYCQYCDLWW